MDLNSDALQSYVAGVITELIAAWYLAHSIEGEIFTPVLSELLEQFRHPKPILNGFDFEDNLTRLENAMALLSREQPEVLHQYLTDGVQMGQYLVEHVLAKQGLAATSLKDVESIEWSAEDLSSQADIIVRYRDASGDLKHAEYSAKSGESPPAAQSRGLGAYRLTVPQCRWSYRQGVQEWLDQHPILYPNLLEHGYEIAIDGEVLQGRMDLNNHLSSDEGVDLEHVPLDFYQSYEEWNAFGNLAMCDALLRHMSVSVDDECMAYRLVNEYLTLAEQSGAVLYVLQPDSPPSLQSALLQACIQIRTAGESDRMAGEIRRKSDTATWTICDADGHAVLGIMIRNAFGRGPKPGSGKTHSVPERVKIQMTLAAGDPYEGQVLARFSKSTCAYTV